MTNESVCYFEAILIKLEDVRRSSGSVLGEGCKFLNSVVVLLGREVLFLASVGVNSMRLNMFYNKDLAVAKCAIVIVHHDLAKVQINKTLLCTQLLQSIIKLRIAANMHC